MSNQALIDYEGVLAAATRMGFRHERKPIGGESLVYTSPIGFSMAFSLPWLHQDGAYPVDQVRNQLTAMMKSAKMDEQVYRFLKDESNIRKINEACEKFGMTYDEQDKKFYYVVDGSALFGVDHDYIASLVCTGKATMDKLGELLDTFKETAEHEMAQIRLASGDAVVGVLHAKGKKKNESKKPGKKPGKKPAKRKAANHRR